MTDLKRLREVAAKATQGPWTVSSQYGRVDVFRHPYNPGDDMVAERVDAHDAEFIATIRNEWDALLDRLEAAEAAVERVRAKVDQWPTHSPNVPLGRGTEYRQAVTQCAHAIRAALAPKGANRG